MERVEIGHIVGECLESYKYKHVGVSVVLAQYMHTDGLELGKQRLAIDQHIYIYNCKVFVSNSPLHSLESTPIKIRILIGVDSRLTAP